MDWTPEPHVTETISRIVIELMRDGHSAKAARVADLLRPLSEALDKSA